MIKTYAEHRKNLAKKPKGKFTDLWFDEIYEHICIELNDKAGMDHKHPELTDDLVKMVCDLVNDGAELLDKAEERDKAVKIAEDLAGHIDDARGWLKTMHESFQSLNSEEAIELLTDALEVAKENSIVPPPATQRDLK